MRNGSLIVASALVVAACTSEPAAPSPEPAAWRTYALTHINGQVPPQAVATRESDTLSLLTDTLILGDDGIALLRTRLRTSSAGVEVGIHDQVVSVPYVVEGDSITIGAQVMCVTFPCPSPLRGSIGEAGLEVEDGRFTPLRLNTYARVHGPTP